MVATAKLEISPPNICLTTPDGDVRVVLEYLDEVRFGPAYYALWMQAIRTGASPVFRGPGRHERFGRVAAVSCDGRFLVLERWASLVSPDTSVVALDLSAGVSRCLRHVGRGFLRAVEFQAAGVADCAACIVSLDVYDGARWSESRETLRLDGADAWAPVEWWPDAMS